MSPVNDFSNQKISSARERTLIPKKTPDEQRWRRKKRSGLYRTMQPCRRQFLSSSSSGFARTLSLKDKTFFTSILTHDCSLSKIDVQKSNVVLQSVIGSWILFVCLTNIVFYDNTHLKNHFLLSLIFIRVPGSLRSIYVGHIGRHSELFRTFVLFGNILQPWRQLGCSIQATEGVQVQVPWVASPDLCGRRGGWVGGCFTVWEAVSTLGRVGFL